VQMLYEVKGRDGLAQWLRRNALGHEERFSGLVGTLFSTVVFSGSVDFFLADLGIMKTRWLA